jgi:hypothetical protein
MSHPDRGNRTSLSVLSNVQPEAGGQPLQAGVPVVRILSELCRFLLKISGGETLCR